MKTGQLEGIVLRRIDYSESSIILKVLTREEGIVSFIFPGGKSRKKSGNLIAPLAILTIEFYGRSDSDLAKVKAVSPAVVYKSIPFDPYKSSIVFFMNEVLAKTVKEKEDSTDLYNYLHSMLQILDLSDQVGIFPIKFLYNLTRYLGFYPRVSDNPQYLDLQEGTFISHIPNHPFYVSKENSAYLLAISGTNFDSDDMPKIPLSKRRELVYDLLKYYEVVVDNFKELKSLAILESTFHD